MINNDFENKDLKDYCRQVALESAVITHGLPRPKNLETAIEMENAVRAEGADPATICLYKGEIKIGLSQDELTDLAYSDHAKKISIKDISGAKIAGLMGGTTVAATITIAYLNHIRVFATGGIGGVHRGGYFDISADLPALAANPVIVVCSGAKSILDLPATREYLETMAIPVIGYQTNEFPAFYSRNSGLSVDFRMDEISPIVKFAYTHWSLGLKTSVLVTVPPPEENALPKEYIDDAISRALVEANERGVSGSEITPFLLSKINDITQEKSMAANISLLINNARVAGKIAATMGKTII